MRKTLGMLALLMVSAGCGGIEDDARNLESDQAALRTGARISRPKVRPHRICEGEFAVITAKVDTRVAPAVVFITVTNAAGEVVSEQLLVVNETGKSEVTTSFLATPGIAEGKYAVTARVEDEAGTVLDTSKASKLIIQDECCRGNKDHGRDLDQDETGDLDE